MFRWTNWSLQQWEDSYNNLIHADMSVSTQTSLSDPDHLSDVWTARTGQSFKSLEEVNMELHQLRTEHELAKANELADFLIHKLEVDAKSAQKPPKHPWCPYWMGSDHSYMSESAVVEHLEQIHKQKKIDEKRWLNDTAPPEVESEFAKKKG